MTLHWNCQKVRWVRYLSSGSLGWIHLSILSFTHRKCMWHAGAQGSCLGFENLWIYPPHSMILMLVFFLCVPWLGGWRVRTCFCFNLSLSEWCWVLHPLIQLLWSSLVCLSNSTRSVGTSFQTNRKPKWKKWSSGAAERYATISSMDWEVKGTASFVKLL